MKKFYSDIAVQLAVEEVVLGIFQLATTTQRRVDYILRIKMIVKGTALCAQACMKDLSFSFT